MEKVLEALNELDKNQVAVIVFLLLKEGKIDYSDLSTVYVDYLKSKERDSQLTINGLSIPLIQYWQNGKMMKSADHARFIRSKAAYNLLKGKVFHTAPIEKELVAYVEDNGYSEDSSGMHTILKK